jgi:hypothetical protein
MDRVRTVGSAQVAVLLARSHKVGWSRTTSWSVALATLGFAHLSVGAPAVASAIVMEEAEAIPARHQPGELMQVAPPYDPAIRSLRTRSKQLYRSSRGRRCLG